MNLFENQAEILEQEILAGLDRCTRQILKNLPEFTEKFQSPASEGLKYWQVENTDWTNGFWTGEIWLAYEHCKEECLKKAALKQCESFHCRIVEGIGTDMHDLGFLYSPSCVAAYKVTGDEKAKEAALLAAERLIKMYRDKGEFIQSLDLPENEEWYKMIVDCLMNLGLLYWASEVTGDEKYKNAAQKHFLTTKKYVFRPDGSTVQAMQFDPKTGELRQTMTHQGYSDASAWSRGQSWAVYGPAISYKYTKMEECISMFRKASKYFLTHLPKDLIAYFDLIFTEGDEWPRDSSANAVVACGLLEMSKYLPKEEAEECVTTAKKIAKVLYDDCMIKDGMDSNGILLHSTYCCSTPYNKCAEGKGVDECCSFGDYYYMELLTRLKNPEWEMYW